MAADKTNQQRAEKKLQRFWVGGPGPTRPGGTAGLCRAWDDDDVMSFEALVENV